MKIGITGSLSSGKSSVAKILSKNKKLLFSADDAVKNLYLDNKFKKKIKKKFKIKRKNIKKEIKLRLLKKEISIKELGAIIHPFVRKRMKEFHQKNIKKEIIFFEIPLLIESKLMKNFDTIFFIKSKKRTRIKRFKSKGGNLRLFNLLNNKQLSDAKKARYCNHIVVNEKNLKFLKKTLSGIFKQYE